MILISNNVARGYTLEYYVARELSLKHGVSIIDDNAYKYRKKITSEYESDEPIKSSQLLKLSSKIVDNMPTAASGISFVHSSFNHGEVYDVIYKDEKGKDIKLSVKTKNMEDKAYRFSTKNYILVSIQSYLQELFSDFSKTYAQSLSERSMTTDDLAKNVVFLLKDILLDETHPDNNTFFRLIENSFIGNGDFYRNDQYGNIVYFPFNPHNGMLIVDENSVVINGNHLVFNAITRSDNGDKIQEYVVDMRLKFKDGQNKIVSHTPEGYVKNYAATVKVNMV